MKTPCSFHKKLLSAAVISTLGLSASGPVGAEVVEFGFVGSFTMLNNFGSPVPNNASPYVPGYNDPYDWNGKRTPIVGTIAYDTVTGAGVGTIAPFLFFGDIPGSGPGTNHAFALGVTFQKIDATNLIGSLLFSWNGGGHSVSIVLDASGMLNNLAATTLSGSTATISGVGALPGSDSTNFGTIKAPITFPLGPTPLATKSLNTGSGCDALTLATQVSPTSITTNQPNVDTCTTGMADDGVPGDPMASSAFGDFNANFDFRTLVVAKKDGVYAPPSVFYKWPAADETLVPTGSSVKFSFVNPMQPATVAFALRDASGATVTGTLSPNSGSPARHFTFTPSSALAEPFTYTATISSATDENGTSLSAPVSWNFTTGTPPPPGACTPTPQVPQGGNFTMLAGNGGLDQGTNDVSYSLDTGNLNTAINGTNFNNTLSSPTSYYGHLWTAHHIRLFGQGTWEFNSGCTVAELVAGTLPDNCAVNGARLTMTVGAGQIGAHMLFDWKTSTNIDVVNVWDQNATWSDANGQGDPAATNDLWSGPTWGGPAGVALNPLTTWQYVSTDPDGDGINGVKMVDGPFIGFNANFNLGAATSCLPGALTVIDVAEIASASGCSIGNNPAAASIADKSEWLLIGGFLAWLGVIRRRLKRQS